MTKAAPQAKHHRRQHDREIVALAVPAFGALVGSLIIGIVVELTNIWLPGDFKYATALLILILILVFRPQGIFGRKERVG